MQRKLLFLFLLILSTSLSAENNLSKAEVIITSESSPSAIVNGTVNAIEGSFYFSSPVLHVPGCEPMHVVHHYNSKNRYAAWAGSGMSLNYSFWITGKSFPGQDKEKHGKHCYINAESSGGSIISCLAKDKIGSNTFYLDPAIVYKGLTNCGSGEISAQTNLKNTYIKEKVKYAQYGKRIMHLSDGTIKEYHWSDNAEAMTNVKQEKRPNRTVLDYTYHSNGTPKKITAKRHNVVNWLEFHTNYHEATVSTSNGKKASYKYFKKDNANYVSEIRSSDSPTQKFHYTKVGDHHCIDRILWPEGRFLEIEYDSKGRVTAQKAPVGKNNEKQTICSFSYHDDYTKVLDAEERKKIYRHEHHRLTSIEQYKKDESLYRINAFFWGKRKGLSWGSRPKTEEGNLLAEALLDANKKAHYARCFTYDDYGNVTKETIYGNLTGTGPKKFDLSSDGTPESSKVEHYSKHYTYSNDRFHLKLSESQSNGPTIKYKYKAGTNIPWAKYVCDGSRILIREFYSYDKNGVLIEKIIDDGDSQDKSNLSHVSERHITRIESTKEKAGFGLPKVISEYYLDLKKNKGVLLKRTKYAYNKRAQVTKEAIFDATNTHQYTLITEYDHKGRVFKQRDALGRWFVFTYDKNSNKIREEQDKAGFYTRYHYDKANRLIAEIEHHYDGTSIQTTYSYDLMGNKRSSTDRYGYKTFYGYDSQNRLCHIALPELEDGSKNTIFRTWDIFDNLKSETDQNKHTTTFAYTARRQPLCTTFADGSQEKYEYNPNGTLKHKWDRSNTRTSYTYDIFNRITKTEVFDASNTRLSVASNNYNAFHLLSSTDPMGIITYHNYDNAGRKVEEWTGTSDNYSKTTFEYDSLSRVSCTRKFYGKNIDNSIATYTDRDFLNRLILEKQVDMKGNCTNWTYYEYDQLGNCIKKSQGLTQDSQSDLLTLYNSKSEPIKVTDEHGHHTHLAIDHNFRNRHQKLSPRKLSTDPLGNITEEYFDSQGRLISLLKRDSKNTLLAVTDFFYNGTGKKIKQIEKVLVDGRIDYDYVISWKLDNLDRVIALTEQPDTPDQKITKYTYDKSGRLLTLTKPDGVILSHAYDALGRLTRLSSSDNTVSYTYTYDLHNNPIEVVDEVNSLTTTRTYDAWDRILSDGIQYHAQSFAYDALGRLTSLIAPDGSSIDYAYDHAHLSSVKRGDYIHTYNEFDLKDRVLKSTPIGSNDTISFTWDKKGRNTKIESNHFTQEIPENGFDPVGNLKKYHTLDPVGEIHFEASYDDLYQLISESGVQSNSYTNDSVFNRRQKNDREYYVDSSNKLLSDSEENYTYDKNGNLIEKKAEGRSIYFTYDALDRLIKIDNGYDTVLYTYDYLHRRTSKTINEEDPEYFLYLGCREVGLFDPFINAMKEYRVLGLGKGAELGASIAIELGENVYCPIHDHRGNIVCLIDLDGKVQESYRYTAFGETEIYEKDQAAVFDSPLRNPWMFASKRVDPETGFVYFHRRYYAPNIGRWITPDPLGFADGPNMYAYVHNNPLTGFDLYGLLDDGNGSVAGGAILYGIVEEVLRGHLEIACLMIAQACSSDGFGDGGLGASHETVLQVYDALSPSANSGIDSFRSGCFKYAEEASGGPGTLENSYSLGRYTTQAAAVLGGARSLVSVASWSSKIASEAPFMIKNIGNVVEAENASVASAVKEIGKNIYIPKSVSGGPVKLPANADGVHLPSSNLPHTQLGSRKCSKTGVLYRQSREWKHNGKPIKTTDWTDHTAPKIHPNPHDHLFSPNPTGGTLKRDDAVPFKITDEKTIMETK